MSVDKQKVWAEELQKIIDALKRLLTAQMGNV
jgi:hypothetical protein